MSYFLKSFVGFFFITLLGYGSAFAQLTPPIQNFLPEVYAGENQNWSITQASNGRIYLANHRYLLEYNGHQWNLYRSEAFQQIRKVFAHENRIYSGGYMTFGYWEATSEGKLNYHSLNEAYNIPILNGEEFWDIKFLDGLFIFQSLARIYIVDPDKGTYDIIDSKTSKPGLFLINQTLYFVDNYKGIRKIESGIIQKIQQDPNLELNEIIGLIQLDGIPHFISSSGVLYRLEDDYLNKSVKDLKQYSEIYTVHQSQSGQILLGTITQGMIVLNQALEKQIQIDKKRGGINNTVLSLFEDREGNVWAGLDRGITQLNLQSPFKEYNNSLNDIGSVYTSSVYQDHWYVGTNQGLFYTAIGGQEPFKLVEGTSGQVWNLNIIQGELFCSHNKGVFRIDGDRSLWLGDQNGSWAVKPILGKDGETLLVSGGYEGLYIYSSTNGNWRLRNRLEGLQVSSRFFEFHSSRLWLVNHEFLGVYILEVDPDFRRVIRQQHTKPFGNASNLFQFSKQLFYLTSNGVFKFLAPKQTFVFDSLMSSKIAPRSLLSSYVYQSDDDQLLFFSDQGLRKLSTHDLNQKLLVDELYLPPVILQNLGNPGFENVHALSSTDFLVGLSDGFITIGTQGEKKNSPFKPSLSTITILKDDRWISIPIETDVSKLKPTENSLQFQYSVPQFQKHEPIFFQSRLIGVSDQWSPWTQESKQEYYKLKPGSYTFEFRYKEANRTNDVVYSYPFIIARPWYLSNAMVLFYITAIALVVYFVFRMASRYRKVQVRLKEEKAERIALLESLGQKNKQSESSNDQLRQELYQKKRELTFTYQSIIKNNTVMSRVQETLEPLNHLDPKINQMMNLIKKSLNNQNDWRNFEKSFNELDNNFIVKLKALHKELTPQDIRLISYIRVNLDSKEIAELLNITLKSVEMKRYRLKKKLQLKQEDKLVDYIFSIA